MSAAGYDPVEALGREHNEIARLKARIAELEAEVDRMKARIGGSESQLFGIATNAEGHFTALEAEREK